MLSDTMMLGGGRKAAYPIDNSLLFRGAQYLTRTSTVAGNRKTWTFSVWVRLSALSGNHEILHAAQDGDNCICIMYSNELIVFQQYVGNVLTINLGGEARLCDPGGWMNIVVSVDTTQDSPLDRARLFINGVLQQQVALPDQNSDTWVNTTYTHYIGRYSEYGANFWDGYLAEPILIDGAALSPDVFGQIDPVTGSWRPKAVSGVDFGPNGFYLGKPWNAASLGIDASGRGNDWTPVGFSASDVLSDSPTNVYATLNPLDRGSGTNTNGNLSISAFTDYAGRSTLGASSGKWYFEVSSTVTSRVHVGVCPASSRVNSFNGSASSRCDEADAWVYDSYSGSIYKPDGSSIAYGNVWTSGADVIGVALDLDAGKIWFSKNGVWQNSGDPVTGANPAATGLSGFLMPFYAGYTVGSLTFDFGQRPFAFTPPDGFKSLCTANLAATTGQTSGTFTGNANADGPCVFTGAVPETLSVNGNPVTWGTHADKLATGFKIRSASTDYNASGANSWVATYDRKPTVGPKNRAPANAQGNP